MSRPSSAPAGSSSWSGATGEEGDHDGLLARGGHYATQYNTYFRHQTPDYRPPELPEDQVPLLGR